MNDMMDNLKDTVKGAKAIFEEKKDEVEERLEEKNFARKLKKQMKDEEK